MTAMKPCFFRGVDSIFSFDRVRLFDDIEAELDSIRPCARKAELDSIRSFACDADAIRRDFENVGLDIQKAVLQYEQNIRNKSAQ